MAWRATGLPEVRRELIGTASWMLDNGIRYKLHALNDFVASGQQLPEGGEEMHREMRWLDAHPDRLHHAELYWVTEAMAELALDASTDLPTFVPSATMPALAGVIAFAGGLPPLPTVAHGEHVPVNCQLLTWVILNGELVVTAWGSTQDAPEEVDLTDWAPKWFQILMVGLPVGSQVVDEAIDGGEVRSLVYLLGAAWILMQMPTIAERRTIAPNSKTERRKAARLGQVNDVALIDLRRLQNVDNEHAGETDQRAFHHRWVVRGHWRQQRHGTGLSQVEPRWVHSYVKGPDGAPFLAREHVHVWRR